MDYVCYTLDKIYEAPAAHPDGEPVIQVMIVNKSGQGHDYIKKHIKY